MKSTKLPRLFASDFRLRPALRKGLLGAFFATLLAAPAFAQVTNLFNDGEGSSTSDQYPGAAADGWVEGWTEVFGSTGTPAIIGYFGVAPHVISTTPLNGGGNYFNFGFANSESTIRRRYTNKDDLDVREPHIIEFDFRADDWLPAKSQFNNANDHFTICTRPNTGSGASDNNSTFWIKALGLNNTNGTAIALSNRWNFYDGNIASSSENQGTFTNAALPAFAFGVTFHFKIETDPSTKTYVATVSDGINTFKTGTLKWRQYSSTSEGNRTNATYLTFASRTSTRVAQPAATETNVISIDNVTIYHAPFDNVIPKMSKITPQDGHVYYDVTSNIVLNAWTIGPTNTMPSSNMVLILNGVDVSSSFTFSGTDADINRMVTNNAVLTPNTIYNATFIAADQAHRSNSISFWFDTFVPSNVTIVEAENYNFSTNLCPGISTQTNINPARYLQDPLPSGLGNLGPVNMDTGYFGRVGEPGVDYFDVNGDGGFDYRSGGGTNTGCDLVGLRKKSSQDYERPELTALTLPEYITERWQTNEWLNYTRIWPGTNYLVYLRVGSGINQHFQLDVVTSDRSLPNQTTSKLGIFDCPLFQRREALAYRPLTDAFGNPIHLNLNGETTLRLTSLDSPSSDQAYINFMLFLPQTGTAPPYVTQFSPAANAVNVSPDTNITVTIANGTLPVSTGTIVVKANGTDITGSLSVAATSTGASISGFPPYFFPQGATNTLQVIYGDGSNPLQTNQWTFKTSMYLPGFDRVLHNPAASGANFSFNIVTVQRAMHIIEYKDTLAAPSWNTLTNIIGTGGTVIVNDNTGGNQRLYRMRIP